MVLFCHNQNAWALTGWQKINNHWYYFDPTNAWADRGWFKSGAGNWYYFDNQNAWALTNWQKINNRWYYFDPTNAWADRGWFKSGAGNWYYFDPTNAWADTGWLHLDFDWYYFDSTNAWALTGWQKINNRWYYFDPSNAWAVNDWQMINDNWYYFDPENYWMLTGVAEINGEACIFKDSGEWTGETYASVAQATAQLKIKAAQAKVNAAQEKVDDAQSQFDDDKFALNKAKDELEGVQKPNVIQAPQAWLNAWKGILRKKKNVSSLSYKDQTVAAEFQTILNTNKQGSTTNYNSWKDNPIDEKIPVTLNSDSTLSDHDATVATQYAVYLLNQIRAQLGTPLYHITNGSVAVAQDTAKTYLKDNWNIWDNKGHDLNALNTVLPQKWGVSYVCESLYGDQKKLNNLNDLKHLVYDAVICLIFESDHSSAQQFGHATDLLGIRLNSDLNYIVQGELLGISIDSKKGLEVLFNSIANPHGNRIKQQLQIGFYTKDADPSSKVNQAPYNEEIAIPDYKVDPAEILPYQQAVTAAENKMKKSQSILTAAQDQLKQKQAILNSLQKN
ncbi:SEC10/PgrA surface exclusion domain-containing protein [Limosilactobacillus kribbianus]|uniref:SEC10/PgrA surface exclusion domain-containing protein n=1 Tax=Limosilactobacillus kribbianus TaxID=2982695 RepID=UPI002264DA23|nr:SEC10/PgrA surface exclusion domain-containing protein [Limosilactobacillus kribbianus]